LALQQGTDRNAPYDILHVDAFSGDGIPTHLLTREAIAVYLSRLKDDGLLLFHISNRYYDLRPVLKSTAAPLGLHAAFNVPARRSELHEYQHPNQCFVLARTPKSLQPLLARGWIAIQEGDGLQDIAAWSDDYVNILAPLAARLQVPDRRSVLGSSLGF
jgi:spermidine synthase